MNNQQIKLSQYTLHDEVTGSAFVNKASFPDGCEYSFLLDYGMFQESKYFDYTYNRIFTVNASKIDDVFVTHGHFDHVGRLPILIKNGFTGSIYTSEATKAMLLPLYSDALSIAKQKERRFLKKEKSTKNKIPTHEHKSKNKVKHEFKKEPSKNSNYIPLYNAEDVVNTIERVQEVEFLFSFKVHRYVTVTFVPNAHLLGAASILIQLDFPDAEPKNLYFTGDYKKSNKLFPTSDIPSWILNLKNIFIFTESTYGNLSLENTPKIEKVFEKEVSSTIAKNGNVVIPVLSNGRLENVLLELKEMQERKEICKNTRIIVQANLGLKLYNVLYSPSSSISIQSHIVDFMPSNVTFIYTEEERVSLFNDSEAKIYIVTSGMGDHGVAPIYLSHFISDNKASIVFTSFLSLESLGRLLLTAKHLAEVKIYGKKFIKKANVVRSEEFSSHATPEDLIELISSFKDVKGIFINHGEISSKENFKKNLSIIFDPFIIYILTRAFYLDISGINRINNSRKKPLPFFK